MRFKEALRSSNAPDESIHFANARRAVTHSTEPHGAAAGTACVLGKACEIQMAQMESFMLQTHDVLQNT